MIGAPADLLSLLYVAVALYTLWQLPSRWRSLTDATYTEDDRNLAGRVGFLLLTPLGVLVHELAHMAAAVLLGGRNISLSYRVYWGYVQYSGNLGATAEWIVAVAGPAASLALGLAVGYGVLRLRQPWRDIGMSFAHATLLLDLILYPGMSLLDGVGDFRWIYSAQTPVLSTVAGVAHAAGLGAYLLLARLHSRLQRREVHDALTERFAGQQVTLREEILERLTLLETAERARHLLPEEREELKTLRELRTWSEAHNQAVVASVSTPPASAPTPPASAQTPPASPPEPTASEEAGPTVGPGQPPDQGPHPNPRPRPRPGLFGGPGPLPGFPLDDDRRN
ncbi:MAG: hypothetical protein IT306_12780 [Chloroflexi bacterium]|nr:hypothetical protein [Chloroflexota bacterium]